MLINIEHQISRITSSRILACQKLKLNKTDQRNPNQELMS